MKKVAFIFGAMIFLASCGTATKSSETEAKSSTTQQPAPKKFESKKQKTISPAKKK